MKTNLDHSTPTTTHQCCNTKGVKGPVNAHSVSYYLCTDRTSLVWFRHVFPDSQRHRCLVHILRNILSGAHRNGLSNMEEWKARKHAQRVVNELAEEGVIGDDAVLQFKKRMRARFSAPRNESFHSYLDRAKFDVGEGFLHKFLQSAICKTCEDSYQCFASCFAGLMVQEVLDHPAFLTTNPVEGVFSVIKGAVEFNNRQMVRRFSQNKRIPCPQTYSMPEYTCSG